MAAKEINRKQIAWTPHETHVTVVMILVSSYPRVIGIEVDPRNDTSIAHGTIVGNKVCMTYNPPAKTEMRADSDSWPLVSVLIVYSGYVRFILVSRVISVDD